MEANHSFSHRHFQFREKSLHYVREPPMKVTWVWTIQAIECLTDRQKLHADHIKQIPSHFRIDLRRILE
jgi:hypothetical protein